MLRGNGWHVLSLYGVACVFAPALEETMFRGALLVYGINKGDVFASEGQLKALRKLRSKGSFSAYADEWTRQFVRTDRDQYGNPK